MALDDVGLRLAALADQLVVVEADVHVAGDELGPILEIGLEDRLEAVSVGQLDDHGALARRRPGRHLVPNEAGLLEDADRAQHHIDRLLGIEVLQGQGQAIGFPSGS